MTTCSGVQFQLGLKRRRVQCTALTDRPPQPSLIKTKSETVLVSGVLPVLVGPAGVSFLGSCLWFFFPVPACFCLFFFFLLLFLSIGGGRHVSAPGWEGRRVKRTGTDPRTGGGADPRTGFFQVSLYVRLSSVPRRACLVLCLPVCYSISAYHNWSHDGHRDAFRLLMTGHFYTPPLSRSAVRAQTLQNGKVPVFRLLPLRVHVSSSGISLQEGTCSWETFADFPGDDFWSCFRIPGSTADTPS